MNAADHAFMAGFSAALDLAERAGARILQGQWGNVIRREHAAGGLLAFVDAARAEFAEGGAITASLSPNAQHVSHLPPESPVAIVSETAVVLAGVPKPDRSSARAAGYTGDMCPDCLNLTMVRNGTCLKCDTCGSTTGCS